MIPIDYTQFKDQIKIKTEKEQRFIFDPIRKKHLVLTPEEFVRQLVILYLVQVKNYNINYINVEKQLIINGLKRRFDIIVYDSTMQPFLLVECKAPKIPINQATFDQIAQYNMPLQTQYLMVTNGIHSYCCSMDYGKRDYTFLEEIPTFKNVK